MCLWGSHLLYRGTFFIVIRPDQHQLRDLLRLPVAVRVQARDGLTEKRNDLKAAAQNTSYYCKNNNWLNWKVREATCERNGRYAISDKKNKNKKTVEREWNLDLKIIRSTNAF